MEIMVGRPDSAAKAIVSVGGVSPAAGSLIGCLMDGK
jgi:hypothetical protein